MIEFVIGLIVGSIITYFYLTFKLHRVGLSWKLLVGKIAEDKLRKNVR